jgi:GTP cyclohydrolase III
MRKSTHVGRVAWQWRRTARAGKDAQADARKEGVEEGTCEVGIAHLDVGENTFLVEAQGVVKSSSQYGCVQQVCPASGFCEGGNTANCQH